ncbi:hypothetical protein M2171_005579 [Bradyrhizobium japonicum USDA 38]|uniref:hypothetical protein n=1 Tax=Bradyrhizobium japonicum TaxID=375 RepID=UPI000489B9B5|nr:hypothetical protein [Bradyrhizobium japonicum]MCS3896446.1 hypothetical protein [Bradyrhizobium japonicum USDA 38]MCS3948961.1 hypothetical protein [Bradyrhizobium japonicum]
MTSASHHKSDRALLLSLVSVLSVSRARLSRDGCGDWTIRGRRGHISTDSVAAYVYLTCKTKRRWEAAKRELRLVVAQDGSDEGIIRIDDLPPSESQAEILRRLLGLRKSVRPSDKQRATLASFHFRRDKPGVSGRFIASAEAAVPPVAGG